MTKKRPALDTFRLVAALLVVAVHISPLTAVSPGADFVLTRIYARVAVPFFFVMTGYFLYARTGGVYALVKKTAKLYILAIVIYLPLNIYNGYFSRTALRLAADILLDGTFYHLWYLPAVMLGSSLVFTLERRFGLRTAFFISVLLYIIGLGGDSYYGFATQIPTVNSFYNGLFSVIRYTRNGFFFAPVFILLGVICYKKTIKLSVPQAAAGLIISLVVMTAEGIALRAGSVMRHDSMYIALVPCMFFLFTLLKKYDGKASARRRAMSTAIYIIHPWVIVAVWYASVLLGIDYAMEHSSVLFFALAAAISCAGAAGAVRIFEKQRKSNPDPTARAWVQVDLSALRHNIRELKSRIPEGCELMAVVKADAYGMGAERFSAALYKMGVYAFAVATFEEAAALRKSGLDGEILVLGRTPPQLAPKLKRYNLTQMVIDSEYARALGSTGKKLRVHIAVDTGMHRLGIDAADFLGLESVFEHKNLTVEGIATHLAVADSLEPDDIEFTKIQLERFFTAVNALRQKGYNPGKPHVQASYGIYNYQGLDCGYVRAGIALHGMMSHSAETIIKPELRPVFALKARVAEVRWIDPGESVSYGRFYTARERANIATVSIGYADGVPRQLSGSGWKCLIRGQKAPIAGRICMDLIMLDVTGIDGVAAGDIVTLIGSDGAVELNCEDFAECSGTITNDTLCRLGKRLSRVYIGEE